MNGVIIDYQLPADWDKNTTLKLQIRNSSGSVIRTFSSAEQKGVKNWTGGPGPQRRLPAQPGLNRFSWDLRTEPIPGVQNVFVMGGHNGPRVIPGEYAIVFMSDKKGMKDIEVKATVLPDPRIGAAQEDYIAQQQALDKISELARNVHQSVNQFRLVKAQLSGRVNLLNEMEQHSGLAEIGKTALSRINTWEKKLVQRKQKTFQDVINFRNQLNAELMFLGGSLDTNSPRPPKSSLERLEHLSDQWNRRSRELRAIIDGPIAEFNNAYRQSGLPSVIIPDK